MKNLLLHAFVIICTVVAGTTVKANAETSDLSNHKKAFIVSGSTSSWSRIGEPYKKYTYVYEQLNYNEPAGGSSWTFRYAVHDTKYNYIQIGDPSCNLSADLTHDGPIQLPISMVVVRIELPGNAETDKLKDLKLLVYSGHPDTYATNSTDENPTVLEQTIRTTDPLNHASDLHFIIDNPKPDKYYQLKWDVDYTTYDKEPGRIMNIVNVTFYTPHDFMPVFEFNAAEKYSTVTSEKGALHLIAAEYTADRTFIRDIISADVKTPTRAVPFDDTSWTHKVAEQDVPFRVDLPSDDSHLLHIRAKSEFADGSFSKEASRVYSGDGVETSTNPSIIDDTNAEPVYYDLFGRRLNAPAPGVCIKVSAGKTTKILTR